VPDNPLLTLKLEEIRSIKLGERSVSYKTRQTNFEVTFTSREERDEAVHQWCEQARERGEFFRLDAIKGLLRRRSYQR
jgi:hypothetical protein